MYYVGIDVGGTNLKAGVVDEQGKIISKVDCPTQVERGHEAVVENMARLALQAVNTFRRKLHVDVFRLVFIAGGPDPYDVAMLSGRVRAALDGLYPLARRALIIREREVRVGADFLADKSAFAGRLKLTIRIGQVLAIGLVFAWKALMLYLKDRKKHKNDPPKETKKKSETPEERNAEHGT